MNIDKKLDEKIRHLMYKPTDSTNVIKALNGKTKMIVHTQFKNYKTIDELLKPYDNIVVLIEELKNMGHFCLLFKYYDKDENKYYIEWFDPYKNYLPEDEYEFIDKDYLKETNTGKKILCKLLYDSEYDLIYNDYEFQNKKDKKMSTCGRWVLLRYLFNDLSIDDFYKLIECFTKELNESKDYVCTLITYKLFGF